MKVPNPIQQIPIATVKPLTQVTRKSNTQVTQGSLASSSKPSKSKSKNKSDNNELLRVAKLLLAKAQASDEEESENSEESINSTSKDPYASQFQDVQDPFA